VRISRWINILKTVLTRRQLFSSGFLPDGSTNCNDAGGDRWDNQEKET
jgi:hypothetical protein